MAPAGLLVSRVGEKMSLTEDLRLALGVMLTLPPPVLERMLSSIAEPSVMFVAGFCTAAASSLLPIIPDANALSLRVKEVLFFDIEDGRSDANGTESESLSSDSPSLFRPTSLLWPLEKVA